MAKIVRWTGYVLGGLLVLLLVAAALVWLISSHKLNARQVPQPAQLQQPTPAQIADGSRQLRVLGCAGCHGPRLQGELFIDQPGLARVYAPNLTLVAARATDDQLDQAIRQGIGHDGRSLIIMPSESYQYMTDAEVAALIAAIRAISEGGRDQPAAKVGPLARVAFALGRFHTAPVLAEKYRTSLLADFGPPVARGRHLTQVNCTECHGPNLTGQEVKPGTVSPDLTIAGAYDLEQFKAMLRTGIAPGKKDIGMMGEVARSDFRFLKDDEIADIHAYLVERAKRAP